MKDPKVTFKGTGAETTLVRTFPTIGKSCAAPVGAWFEKGIHVFQGYCHGMKQRSGDFGALPKEWSDAEKEREHLRRMEAWVAHIEAGGAWKMPKGEVDTSAQVIEAMNRLDPKKYPVEMLEKSLAKKPEQLKVWRANAKVASMIATIRAEKLKKAAKESKEEIEIEMDDE